MKNLYLGALLSALSFHYATAQDNTAHTSKEIIKKAIEEHDKGNYKKSIELLSTIPYGDSTYTLARYELGLSYLADSQLNNALNTFTSIRGNTNTIKRDLIISLGNTHSMLNEHNKAYSYYDSAKAIFPHDHRAYFESAVVYLKEEKKEKAIEALQQSALINPSHFRTHWLLGYIYATQGRFAESYLAQMFALTNSNNKNTGFMSVNMLSALCDLDAELMEFYQNKSAKHEHEMFDEINELMVSRIIFNKNFVTRGKIEDKIVKQFQLITEKLKYDAKDNNFAMQYYVPLILDIEQNKLFEDFILYTFSDLDIEEIDKLNNSRKGKEQLKKVADIVFNYKRYLFGTRELIYANRKFENIKYLKSDKNNIFIIGKPLDKNLTDIKGDAVIYIDNIKTAEGKYDDKGQRIGEWKTYHANGNLKLVENYKNGHTRNKEKIWYHENGNLATKIIYTTDSTLKERTDYDYMGRKMAYQIINKDGNFDFTSYHANGKVKEKLVYLRKDSDKLADGSYTTYYANGTVNKKFNIINNEFDGLFEEYYSNGTQKSKINYSQGKRHGPYNIYYRNGKEDIVGNYVDGKKEGQFFEYYETSSEYFTENYKKGKKHGEAIYYNQNKQPFGWITYNNNVPVSYKYQDNKGKVIKAEENNKGITLLPIYNEFGVLTKTITLNKDGNYHGELLTYYSNEKLNSKSIFADGYRNGPYTQYTDKGQLRYNSTYTEGYENGIYTSFHNNGKINYTGRIEDDEPVGLWTEYHKNGNKENIQFKYDGLLYGDDSTFDYNGKLTTIYEYDKGYLIGFKSFDTTGKLLDNLQFINGKGTLTHSYPNGKIKKTVPILHGKFNGSYKEYSPSGILIKDYTYEDGKIIGNFKNWHPNGILSSEGTYIDDQREGIFKYYDESGQLVETKEFKNGKLNGYNDIYNNGNKIKSYLCANDAKNGKSTFYGDKDVIIAYLYYKNDDIVGYSSIDAQGEETPIVPIHKGSGKLKTYYPNGQLALSAEWLDGYYHNENISYYSNGKILEQRTYKNGNIIGVFKRYNENGVLVQSINNNEDGLNGTLEKYDNNGKKFVQHEYFNDMKHGNTTLLDNNGKTINVKYYYDELL